MRHHSSSISNFSSLLIKIIIPYCLLLGFICYVLGFAVEKTIVFNSETIGASKINRILSHNYEEEIPIFGSSRAEGSFIPDSLGEDFYNYGIRGTLGDVWLFFIEQELSKNKQNVPLLISLDIEGLKYRLGGLDSYIPNSNNSDIKKLLGDDYEFHFALPFVKYFGRLEYYLNTYLNDKISYSKAVSKGGAFTLQGLTKEQFSKAVDTRKQTEQDFNNEVLLESKLLNMIDLNKNREFVFVISPYHESYFHLYKGSQQLSSFLNKIDSRINSHVFDFSKMFSEDKYFYNTTHVNFTGAKGFSRVLRDSLVSRNII